MMGYLVDKVLRVVESFRCFLRLTPLARWRSRVATMAHRSPVATLLAQRAQVVLQLLRRPVDRLDPMAAVATVLRTK